MSDRSEEQAWLGTLCLIVIAFVAVAGGLVYTRDVLVPFVLAVFIATIVAPVVDYQVLRLRFPKAVSVAVALLIVLGLMALLTLILELAIRNAARTTAETTLAFDRWITSVETQLQEWQIGDYRIEEEIQQIGLELRRQLPRLVSQSAGTALNLISRSVLTVIFVAFLLAGRNSERVRRGIYAEIDQKVRRYITTKILISAATGLLVWGILALLGLRMASLFGVLAFLLNFIPSIGSIIATLLPIPMALIQSDSLLFLSAVITLPGSVQMTIGNVIEPKLMGEGLELHPATILLSLAFWGLLWGLVGMVLAVPITATVRIVLMRFETTRPIGDLLAGRLPDEEAESSA
jgi:AI-2 transport protein TqsA